MTSWTPILRHCGGMGVHTRIDITHLRRTFITHLRIDIIHQELISPISELISPNYLTSYLASQSLAFLQDSPNAAIS